jgi:chromate transporter
MGLPSLFRLFWDFLYLGATAFGGPAMIAHIRRQIVEKREWLDGSTFDEGLALCQAIPGAIVMQVAAFVGLKLRGIKGALVVFVGFALPSFLLMMIFSMLYKEFKNISSVETVLAGLRVVIAAIVANATLSIGRKTLVSRIDLLISIIAAALFLTRLHPALVVIASAFLGLMLSNINTSHYIMETKANTSRFFLAFLSILLSGLLVLFLFNKEYFVLSTSMLRVDLFAFGGGFAAVPVMLHEIVDILGWLDKKTFLDGLLLGQVTPGSIIITATFIGYLKYGILGCVIATISVFTPSFLILIGIIPYYDKLRKYPQFNKMIHGILCSFAGLLAIVTYHFAVAISWNRWNIGLAIAVFIALLFKVEVIWVILAGILFTVLVL